MPDAYIDNVTGMAGSSGDCGSDDDDVASAAAAADANYLGCNALMDTPLLLSEVSGANVLVICSIIKVIKLFIRSILCISISTECRFADSNFDGGTHLVSFAHISFHTAYCHDKAQINWRKYNV